MSREWNEGTSKLITEKMNRIKEELDGQAVDTGSIAEILEKMHPEVSPNVIRQNVQEMQEGIGQIYAIEDSKMGESAEQILAEQMEGMTEEQQKGFLCQMFDSVKRSDEERDDDIGEVEADSTDIAQMSTEVLRTLVSEQMVNSIKGMANDALEDGMDGDDVKHIISLKTEEDALLLAAAQYSEALEGNIPFEYTKVTRVLGQCAAAQTRIALYLDRIVETDMSEDEKCSKIVNFIASIFIIVACIVLGLAFGSIGAVVMGVAFEAVAALFGTGIIALIAQVVLIYPIVWVSILAMAAAGGLVYAVARGVCKLFKAAVSKVKQWYGKLAEMLGGENPYCNLDEEEEAEDSEWKPDYSDMEMEDVEEDDNLAYT